MDWFEAGLLKAKVMMKSYACKLYKNVDDADDAVQSAYARAWAARDRFVPEHDDSLGAWLLTIIKNEWKGTRRRVSRIEYTDDAGYADHLPAPDNPERRMIVTELFDAVQSLPEEERDCLTLAGIGMKLKETTALLGLNEQAVKNRRMYGRERLMQMTEGGLC